MICLKQLISGDEILLMSCFTLCAADAFFPYVLGHYWKGASTAGTIAALISGGVLFGMELSQPIVPGLLMALVFFLVFSKVFPRRIPQRSWLTRKTDAYIICQGGGPGTVSLRVLSHKKV